MDLFGKCIFKINYDDAIHVTASSQKLVSFIFCTIVILSYLFFKGQSMEYDDAIPMIASSKII